MSTDSSSRFSLQSFLLAVFWAAVCFASWMSVGRLQGHDIDTYTPFLWFGMITPPFALMGLLGGRHRLGIYIGVALSVISLLIVLALDYFQVPS
jgi:hypothetical protein